MFLMIFFFFGFPARFFSEFPMVLSYFSRLLFLLFGFFLSKFRSFHVSDDFFLLWFPARFFSGFPTVLSYFSRLLCLLFGFFLSKFRSFHVSDIFSSLGFLHGSSLGFLLFSLISPGYYFFFLGFFLSKFRSFHVSAVFFFIYISFQFLFFIYISFQFLPQPVVEVKWIFVHIHCMFKHQGKIFSRVCPHGLDFHSEIFFWVLLIKALFFSCLC